MKNIILFYGLFIIFLCGELACKEGRKVHATEKDEKKEILANETSVDTQNVIKEVTEELKVQPSPKKIEPFGTDNARLAPSKLRFTNGKVVDITEIDPYRKLRYKRLREDPDGFEHLYDLSDKPRDQQDEILADARINTDAYRESNYLRLLTQAPVIAIAGGKAAVAYHAFFYSNNEDVLATQGIVIVFNERGEEIRRIKDERDGFYDIKLSNDGKYLMQKYGTNYGEDGGGQLETGFKFYDLETGKLIYEKSFGKDQFLDAFSFIPKVLDWVVIERNPNSTFELHLINLKTRETYFFEGDLERHIANPMYLEKILEEFKERGEIRFLVKQGFKKK